MADNYHEIIEQWRSKEILDQADLEMALENFQILFAYNSNAIENPQTTYHDTREIFENGKVIGFTGDLRTLFEIQNQKKCFEYLADKMISRKPFSEDLIKSVHKMLMENCYDETRYIKGERPGEYKKREYVVGDEIGVPPEAVSEELASICEEVNQYTGPNPLMAAAYFHAAFEAVHPFADGNGRVGRTLLNYYLITHDYPPTIIYNEDKATYYMALAVFDKTGKLDGFVEFLKEQTLKTWGERKRMSLDRLSELAREQRCDAESVSKEIAPSHGEEKSAKRRKDEITK